ncbi:MAG TPA: DeoR/GlpR family DNA-binding transcription regulator [Bacillota bacterium]|nr:DeoR/GlpR family DNA-binding transcription regulator [Bacillota bacterium]
MIRAERIEKIKNLAKRQDIITWEELQRCLNVSKATVQRDADILCNANVLRKTRGGVIFVQEPNSRELSNAAREITNKEAKRQIAAAALEFVHKDSFVMMDSGSTVLELVRQIPSDTPLTAITYSLDTAVALDSKPNIEIFFTGGKLRKDFRACHGYFAENMLSQFHASVCFLGADAVSLANGMSEHNMYDVRLKQIMIENSSKVILLADHSKFTSSAFIHVAPLDQVDVLITDAHLDEATLQEMGKCKIKVIEVSEN